MKWLYRLFTIGMLAGALAVPFFINNQQGKPMLSLPKPSELLPTTTSQVANPINPSSTTVYKWQDQQGGWHYGDEAPADTQNVATLQVDSNTNVIQGLKVEPEAKPEPAAPVAVAPPAGTNAASEVLSLDRVMNILNETRDVKASMEARNEQLKQLAGD